MKVGVIHFNLEAYGGAEYVCLNIIKALHVSGYQVGLCNNSYLDYKRAFESSNIDVKDCIDFFLSLDQGQLSFFKVYQRMAYGYFSIKKLWKEFCPDFIIVTYYPPPIVPRDYVDKTIIYVHYPIDTNSITPSQMPYWKPITFILETLDGYKNAKILTNSKYTANVIKRLWNRKATVIYPPCPLYLDLPLNEKKNWVCTLSRFSPEKRHEIVLEIAKQLPNIEFHLIGNTIPSKWSYLTHLMQKARPLSNVHFHIDAPVQEKCEILKNSKVLLHTMYGEQFGISLVEALSSGTIPIPNDSGGAKEDGFIPSEFRWKTIEDAVNIIHRYIHEWNVSLAKKLREESKKFGQENFQRNIIDLIESWYNTK